MRYMGIILTLLFVALSYLSLRKHPTGLYSKLIKTVMDYSLTFIGSIIISPLLLFIAIWIYKDSPGPVIYKHMRVGKNGKLFPCYKFRSMCFNANQVLEDLLANDPEIRAEWERDFKLKNDPRITRSGAFLRKTSLDELPQIFNVLRGDMSLVGPRPVTQEELDKYYGDATKLYCSIKPGITGLWQVSGRSDLSYSERVALDITYIKHRSLLGDFVILWKTIGVIFMEKGAY